MTSKIAGRGGRPGQRGAQRLGDRAELHARCRRRRRAPSSSSAAGRHVRRGAEPRRAARPAAAAASAVSSFAALSSSADRPRRDIESGHCRRARPASWRAASARACPRSRRSRSASSSGWPSGCSSRGGDQRRRAARRRPRGCNAPLRLSSLAKSKRAGGAADGVDVEPLDRLLGRDDLVVAMAPAEPQQIVAQRLGQIAHVAIGVDAERAVALRQLGAVRRRGSAAHARIRAPSSRARGRSASGGRRC